MSYYAARMLKLIAEIEEQCPCGARPESLSTHPHVIGCPVIELKQILQAWFAQSDLDSGMASSGMFQED
jgi:hypothetical protein